MTAVRDGLKSSSYTEGLGDITKMEFYENGVRTGATEMNQQRDNKILYYSGDIKRVVNYADGYIIDIPRTGSRIIPSVPLRWSTAATP